MIVEHTEDESPSLMASSPAADKVQLKKSFGLLRGVSYTIGIMIGSGIFISPKGVLKEVDSVGASLVIWLACGFYALTGAVTFAELGTSIPSSGGSYAYIKRAWGTFPAFLFIWNLTIAVFPMSNATLGLAFAFYTVQPFFPGCAPPEVVVSLIAAVCICALTFLNGHGVSHAGKLQVVLLWVKILSIMAIVVTGLVQLCLGKLENFQAPFKNTATNPSDWALAFYSGAFSYSGWECVGYVTEELNNPNRDLPRSIFISVPLVTLLYVLANAAYFTALSPQQLLASPAVAMTFFENVFNTNAWFMSVLVAASVLGSLNGCILSVSRVFFVGAREGQLPEFTALLNKNRFTPLPSLIVCCALSLLSLCVGEIYTLLNAAVFIDTLGMVCVVSGLLWLRRTEPHLNRPIKAPTVIPIIFLVLNVLIVLLPIILSPKDCVIGLAVAISGVPVYCICVMWQDKPPIFTTWQGKIMSLTQKVLVALPETKEE